eukprot:CAMPEP_0181201088 /NCGR_PEP_ID=MMETSP1096-20121128/18120_1 /TAXON_ID=156174 ORGANISM="Chrysochromulina ericina, Strain CCMP281" /NCGR_SAMPLE_ID=MMETSP1096 /ASSEMBLY_ACC=CAM_ASM_000453 /LENGTH=61 /DNA_ID=CAMNT_0023291507 /DNA_START=209 /DNA_END=394 /DNA_ORIENTATION=-
MVGCAYGYTLSYKGPPDKSTSASSPPMSPPALRGEFGDTSRELGAFDDAPSARSSNLPSIS